MKSAIMCFRRLALLGGSPRRLATQAGPPVSPDIPGIGRCPGLYGKAVDPLHFETLGQLMESRLAPYVGAKIVCSSVNPHGPGDVLTIDGEQMVSTCP